VFTGSRSKGAWLVLALLLAAFIWTTWPMRAVGSENSRFLVVFNPDEATHFNQVSSAARAHTYQAAWEMGYGYAFFNIVQTIMLVSPPTSDQQVILTLRTVEWAFALATIVFVFASTRRVSTRAALLTALMLVTLPKFLRWSAISHPDIMQMLFICVALDASARRLEQGSRWWTLVAAAAAGVAFASKFAGMFLFPIIWAADLLARRQAFYSPRTVRVTRWIILGAALLMLAGAIILSPQFVAANLTVDGSIQYQRSIDLIQLGRVALVAAASAGFVVAGIGGVWRRLAASPFRNVPELVVATVLSFLGAFTITSAQAWRGLHFVRMIVLNASVPSIDPDTVRPWFGFRLRAPGEMLTLGVMALALVGAVWALTRVRDVRGRSALELAHLAWVVTFGVALFSSLKGHDMPAYYLLPIVPSALFLAARGWELLWTTARPRASWFGAMVCVALAAGLVVELAFDVQRVAVLRHEILAQEELSRPVQLGERLACYVPPQSRFLFDYFSYVPPTFAVAQPTWGGSLALLREKNPDAIIVNATIESFYRAPRGDPAVADDLDPFRYYEALRQNRTSYRLVAEDYPVRLYVKAGTSAPAQTPARICR
jgi:hypothetical protein